LIDAIFTSRKPGSNEKEKPCFMNETGLFGSPEREPLTGNKSG